MTYLWIKNLQNNSLLVFTFIEGKKPSEPIHT